MILEISQPLSMKGAYMLCHFSKLLIANAISCCEGFMLCVLLITFLEIIIYTILFNADLLIVDAIQSLLLIFLIGCNLLAAPLLDFY